MIWSPAKESKRGIILRQSFMYNYSIWHFLRYVTLADVVNKLQGTLVLDVGCGRGMQDFLFEGKTVVGIDQSFADIREAKRIERTIRKEDDAANDFIVADLNFPPLREEFDIVICAEVLEHLIDDERALANMLSMLKNQGFLLLTLPNTQRSRFSLDALLGNGGLMHRSHIREYKVEDLPNLVRFLPLKTVLLTGIYLDFPFFNILDFLVYNPKSPWTLRLRFSLFIFMNLFYEKLWRLLEKALWKRATYIFMLLQKTSTLHNRHLFKPCPAKTQR